MGAENRDLPSPEPVSGDDEHSHAQGPGRPPADPVDPVREISLINPAREISLINPISPISRISPSSPSIPRQDALAEPSWAHVLWTTVRLWLERRVLRGFSRGGGSVTMRRRLTSMIILVAVVFAAGALTVALTNGAGLSSASGQDSAGNPPGSSLAVAAADRRQAARWIAAQVSRSATVACDPAMCAVLQVAGFPSGNLLVLSSAAADPLGSAIVVSTDAIRSEFGGRLAGVYAPVIIARFGSGTARVDVRVTAADGSRAYLAALRADRIARRASGRQLLGNHSLVGSAAARAALAAGNVDSRLLSTLAVLAGTAHLSVDVLSFGDGGPGASPGIPLRYAVIAVLAAGKPSASAQYLQSALSFLRAQQAPFRAASMTTGRASGQPVLRIQFAAPSPLGLLGAGSP
jgi:hypothetical protein